MKEITVRELRLALFPFDDSMTVGELRRGLFAVTDQDAEAWEYAAAINKERIKAVNKALKAVR